MTLQHVYMIDLLYPTFLKPRKKRKVVGSEGEGEGTGEVYITGETLVSRNGRVRRVFVLWWGSWAVTHCT